MTVFFVSLNTPMISERMEMAISPGVTAPIGRPIGACTFFSSSSVMPFYFNSEKVVATFPLLPIMPIYE